MSELVRATVAAIKEETTVGTPVMPTASADFIPLRAGFTASGAIEEITSDEILNSLGASKSYTGKENPTGTHAIYLKHSQTEGVSPEWALFLESALGTKTSDSPTEYDTVSGCTTSVLNVDTGEGAQFPVGRAVLVKDTTYAIRNVASVSSDALTLNYALSDAPAAGKLLGKSVLFKPATSGHPSYTMTLYRGNGGAIEVISGCRTTSTEISLTAGQQAEATFNYAGTSFYYNPINITATNKYLYYTDSAGTGFITLTTGLQKSPVEAARTIENALNAASTDTWTVSYGNTTGKFTIACDTGIELNWTANADQIGEYLGFAIAADDTNALSYTSDNAVALGYDSAVSVLATNTVFAPDYDDADSIIVKDAEIFIGSSTDNVCRKAQSITLSITSNVVDVDSVCSTTGLYEKLPASREVTLNATVLLERYEAGLFDKFINNTTTSVMVNIGPKSGGNWVAGKCINIYLGNASITQHNVAGDEFIVVELACKGFVSSTKEDIYLNVV